MGHYKSNLRDIEFTLFDVLGTGARLGHGPFAEIDEDTARGILDEVRRLAEGPLAESFASTDRNPPVFDPATSSVTMPAAFKKSYDAHEAAEWWRLSVPGGAGRYGRAPVAVLGHDRDGARRQRGRAHVQQRPRVRRPAVRDRQ